jgi:hypothetical protein
MTRGRRFAALLLVSTIPFAPALATSSGSKKLKITDKDDVKLVFEIKDSNHCRIYLLPPSMPSSLLSLKPSVSVTPRSTKKGEVTNPKQPQQRKIVLEYEQKVERMHMAKRAKTRALSDKIDVVFHDENMVVVYRTTRGSLCA